MQLMGEHPDLLRQIDHQAAEGMSRVDGQQLAIDTHEALSNGQKAHQRAQESGLTTPFITRNTGELSVPRREGEILCQCLPANGDCCVFYL